MARDEFDRMMCAEWGLKHEPMLPYDPTVFNPCDVIESIAGENDLDWDTAALVHEWLVREDPDQLEPLRPVADEGWTIPVPDPDVVKAASEALTEGRGICAGCGKPIRGIIHHLDFPSASGRYCGVCASVETLKATRKRPHMVTDRRKRAVREKYGSTPEKAERLFRQLRAKHKDKSDTEIAVMVEQQLR